MSPLQNPPSMRIGLLTLALHVNYGSIIQIAALYNLLAGQAREVTLLQTGPDRPLWHRALAGLLRNLPLQNIGNVRARHLAKSTHDLFIRRYLPNRSPILRNRAQASKELARRKIEAVVVGSDQVWRRKFAFGSDFLNYFLNFAPEQTRKISYAASFGTDRWQEPDLTDTVKALLARFHTITLREETGRRIVAETFGREDATVVLDPTLLMPASFYEEMLEPAEPSGKPTLTKYVLDPVPELEQLEKSVLRALGPDSRVIRIYLESQARHATIPQWLRAFYDADFVVTDSFHGMAFSIIFRKQFVAVVNQERGADRFISLARQLGLEDRLIHTGKGSSLPDRPIDYAQVESRLEKRRAESLAVLMNSLDG